MNLLAISGSLRKGSFNTSILRALAKYAPEGANVQVAAPIDRVPHFNPDLDGDAPPASVVEWRAELRAADGIIVCSPEYARGVPGALKNAFDWTVSSGDLEGKPLALINASPNFTGASTAHASLREILGTMGAVLLDDSCLSVAGVRGKLDEDGNVIDEDTRASLRHVLETLSKEVVDAQQRNAAS